MNPNKLCQLKRYTQLLVSQWQKQETVTFLKAENVEQEVRLICKNLLATNHSDLILLANWFERQIKKVPKSLLSQGACFERGTVIQVFTDFEQKLGQLIGILFPSLKTLSSNSQTRNSRFGTTSVNGLSSGVAPVSSSSHFNPLPGMAIASPQMVPPPIKAFEQLPTDLQQSIRRAGLRCGESASWQEAVQKYEKMPEAIRRQDIDKIWEYKRQHDWSHKQAHSNGGSSSPENGDWELREINRARGGEDMTPSEIQQLNDVKAQINFNHNAEIVINQSLTAGGIALALEGSFSGLENFLAVQRGEKTIEQGIQDTLTRSVGAAVTTTVIAGGVIGVCITFPPVGTALTTVSPVLRILGVAACAKRLINILTHQPNLAGIDQLQVLMDSYGLDETELKCRDLELDHELEQLKWSLF